MNLKDEKKFKLETGIKREVFFQMLEILTEEFNKAHEKGSNKGIGPGCRLVLALSYWRYYPPYRHMEIDYGVVKSTICTSIKWVEKTLINHPIFQFGNIKEEIEKLEKNGIKVECIIGDVEEQQIERPSDNQKEYYSGKKKMHTEKNQIIIEEQTKKIINFCTASGKNHDFKMLKESEVLEYLEERQITGRFDLGYQGVQDLLSNAIVPIKKPRGKELTEEQKKHNKELAKLRISIEHVNREIKIFRIMKYPYRNHRIRYKDKLQIMCAIYNLNHA